VHDEDAPVVVEDDAPAVVEFMTSWTVFGRSWSRGEHAAFRGPRLDFLLGAHDMTGRPIVRLIGQEDDRADLGPDRTRGPIPGGA